MFCPLYKKICISLTLDLQTGAYSLKANIYTARACCVRQNSHATSLYGYDGFMKHVANSLKHVAWTHHTCTLKFHVSRNKVVWPFKPYTDFSGSNASVTGDRALLTNCGLLSVELEAMVLGWIQEKKSVILWQREIPLTIIRK